jgi:hypothetical protein
MIAGLCQRRVTRLHQAKADLQRSNDARDSLEQAVEEMKRELIAASAASTERSAMQEEVIVCCAGDFERENASHVADAIAARTPCAGFGRSQAAAAALQ